jgi:hypothetical protein
MVKELDLFESNHGCGLNALSKENIRNGRNTTLHGPESVRNVFPRPFGAGRAITHGFSTFEYFDLTALVCRIRFQDNLTSIGRPGHRERRATLDRLQVRQALLDVNFHMGAALLKSNT